MEEGYTEAVPHRRGRAIVNVDLFVATQIEEVFLSSRRVKDAVTDYV